MEYIPVPELRGPAMIVEDTSTTFLPPGYVCDVDDYENLIIEEKPALSRYIK